MLHLMFNRDRVLERKDEGKMGKLLETGNLRFIGLVGLGPASRDFTFHLLDSLLTATTKISICPHMTSYSNKNSEGGRYL